MASHPLFSNILLGAGKENLFFVTKGETQTFLQTAEDGGKKPQTNPTKLPQGVFSSGDFGERLTVLSSKSWNNLKAEPLQPALEGTQLATHHI